MSDHKTRAELVRQAEQLEKQIYPILAGAPSGAQGAVLADLVAMFLAGHSPPEVRESLLSLHVETVRALVPINEKIINEKNAPRKEMLQ